MEAMIKMLGAQAAELMKSNIVVEMLNNCTNEEEKRMMYVDPKEEITIYEPCGCERCGNTGYRGRIGVYEIMEITPALKRMIAKKESSEMIKQQALEDGMKTLRMSAAAYVLDGTTAVSEMLRVSFEE